LHDRHLHKYGYRYRHHSQQDDQGGLSLLAILHYGDKGDTQWTKGRVRVDIGDITARSCDAKPTTYETERYIYAFHFAYYIK